MFTTKLAGHTFAIDNKFEDIRCLYADYLVSGSPEFTVCAAENEIEAESGNVGDWSKGYLETLAIFRKICEKLIDDDIVLFHCSALEMNGKAVLFTAPSGTGKSTHARLWRERFGESVTMINDDKPLLKISDENILVYGTPYGGKHEIQKNTCAPVGAVVILHQAPENKIERLTPNAAFPSLLVQTYRSDTVDFMTKVLPLVGALSRLPVYSLGCTISSEAVELVYNEVFT